jgi:hypothetical protein
MTWAGASMGADNAQRLERELRDLGLTGGPAPRPPIRARRGRTPQRGDFNHNAAAGSQCETGTHFYAAMWLNNTGQASLLRIPLDTAFNEPMQAREWEFFDLTTIAGQKFTGLAGRSSNDSHNTWTIAVDRKGHLHVLNFYHNLTTVGTDGWPYARCTDLADFANPAKWVVPTTLVPLAPGRTDSLTYAVLHKMPSGQLMLTWRNGEAVDGRMYYTLYDEETLTWSFPVQLSAEAAGGTARSFYGHVTFARSGKWVFSGFWSSQVAGVGNDTISDPCMAYSDDQGRTWRHPDGTQIALPMGYPDPTSTPNALARMRPVVPLPPGSDIMTQTVLEKDDRTGWEAYVLHNGEGSGTNVYVYETLNGVWQAGRRLTNWAYVYDNAPDIRSNRVVMRVLRAPDGRRVMLYRHRFYHPKQMRLRDLQGGADVCVSNIDTVQGLIPSGDAFARAGHGILRAIDCPALRESNRSPDRRYTGTPSPWQNQPWWLQEIDLNRIDEIFAGQVPVPTMSLVAEVHGPDGVNGAGWSSPIDPALTLSSAAIGVGRTVTAASAWFVDGMEGMAITVGSATAIITRVDSPTQATINIHVAFAGTSLTAGSANLTRASFVTVDPTIRRHIGPRLLVLPEEFGMNAWLFHQHTIRAAHDVEAANEGNALKIAYQSQNARTGAGIIPATGNPTASQEVVWAETRPTSGTKNREDADYAVRGAFEAWQSPFVAINGPNDDSTVPYSEAVISGWASTTSGQLGRLQAYRIALYKFAMEAVQL